MLYTDEQDLHRFNSLVTRSENAANQDRCRWTAKQSAALRPCIISVYPLYLCTKCIIREANHFVKFGCLYSLAVHSCHSCNSCPAVYTSFMKLTTLLQYAYHDINHHQYPQGDPAGKVPAIFTIPRKHGIIEQ